MGFLEEVFFVVLWESLDVRLVFERLFGYEERYFVKSYCVLNNFIIINRDKKNDYLFIFLRIIFFYCVYEMWFFECLEEMLFLNI